VRTSSDFENNTYVDNDSILAICQHVIFHARSGRGFRLGRRWIVMKYAHKSSCPYTYETLFKHIDLLDDIYGRQANRW